MDALVECPGWECPGCAVCVTYGIDWATAPTKAAVRHALAATSRAATTAREAAMVTTWRAHHPEATCADATALLLASLENEFGRGVAKQGAA